MLDLQAPDTRRKVRVPHEAPPSHHMGSHLFGGRKGRAGPAPTPQIPICLSSEEECEGGLRHFPKVCMNKEDPQIFLPLWIQISLVTYHSRVCPINTLSSKLGPGLPTSIPGPSLVLPPGTPLPSPQSLQVPSLSRPMPSHSLRVPASALTLFPKLRDGKLRDVRIGAEMGEGF